MTDIWGPKRKELYSTSTLFKDYQVHWLTFTWDNSSITTSTYDYYMMENVRTHKENDKEMISDTLPDLTGWRLYDLDAL